MILGFTGTDNQDASRYSYAACEKCWKKVENRICPKCGPTFTTPRLQASLQISDGTAQLQATAFQKPLNSMGLERDEDFEDEALRLKGTPYSIRMAYEEPRTDVEENKIKILAVTPMITLIRARSICWNWEPKASSRTFWATIKARSCVVSVASMMLGGTPQCRASKSTLGRNAPRRA